jgi:hypothetical protein
MPKQRERCLFSCIFINITQGAWGQSFRNDKIIPIVFYYVIDNIKCTNKNQNTVNVLLLN